MIQKITTERIKVSNSGEGMSEALAMTEKTVGLMHLTERNRLRARLLAEEMFNMVRTIAVDFSAEFWIEQTEDRICTLHLEAKSALDYAKRQELISASTTGKNSARLGIMDKIRGIPDDGMTDALYSWSMQKYKKDVEAEKDDDPESWDELEKSIIANIADDVQVGILKDKIELIVVKKF